MDDTTTQPTAKVENQDASVIPWTSSLLREVIDLTLDTTDSPMQLTTELPSLLRAEPERKRNFDNEASSTDEEPRPSPKRRRTMEAVPAPEDDDEGELSLPSPYVPTGFGNEDTDAAPLLDSTPDVPVTTDNSDTTAPPTSSPTHQIPATPQPPDSRPPSTRPPSSAPMPDTFAELSLPSSSGIVQLPGSPRTSMTPVTPAAPSPGTPARARAPNETQKKLSICHIPLIYQRINGRLICRMCQ
ncbi:hypothetical protein C8Q77DRAFT_370288 [Trametes polyzona]|nr:hypothetical protein C8Q77DRAFT_370288 [Trametes polyzona]